MERDLTRRGAIAGVGTTLTVLAGCSFGSTNGGDDDRDLRAIGEGPLPDPPYEFPFSVPESMITFHRERARELLALVPTTVSIPNEAVARAIESERASVASRFEDGDEERGDDEAGTGGGDEDRSARRRLIDWRRTRVDAAQVVGRYRAATGELDRTAVRARRADIRSARADFVAAHEYRATDPTDAVFAHEVLEYTLESVARDLEPYPPFPDDPIDDPDDVGYLVGKLVEANAHLADARQFRTQLPENGTTYRPAMMATATWLRRRARLTETALDRFLENGASAFGDDIEGTPAEYAFDVAREQAREHSNAALIDAIGESSYARAVLEAGRRGTALATLGTVVRNIQNGQYDAQPSVGRVSSLRERAVSAVETTTSEGGRFETRLADPATDQIRRGSNRLQSNASADRVERAAGQFAYAAVQAESAREAAGEVRQLLAAASD